MIHKRIIIYSPPHCTVNSVLFSEMLNNRISLYCKCYKQLNDVGCKPEKCMKYLRFLKLPLLYNSDGAGI